MDPGQRRDFSFNGLLGDERLVRAMERSAAEMQDSRLQRGRIERGQANLIADAA